MLFLIALLVGLSVALVTIEVLGSRRPSLRYRVSPAEPERSDTLDAKPTDAALFDRTVAPGFRRLGSGLEALLPPNLLRAVRGLLVAANEPWSLTGFLAVWAMSVGVGALVWIYVGLSANVTGLQFAVLGMAIMPFAILLPYARIRSRARARQKAIVRALPDAMDLLVTSVEAGMGVDSAFALVTEKTEGPLSETFAQYLRQVGLGRRRRDVLVEVANRTGVEDLVEIANSVNQGEQLGTPVGDVLRVQAEELRLRRRERAKMRAERAPVLMTIPLATCFLPAMVAVIIVPSILNLIDFVGALGG